MKSGKTALPSIERRVESSDATLGLSESRAAATLLFSTRPRRALADTNLDSTELTDKCTRFFAW